jgi:thiamine biosynthesis lipoprotein
MKKFLALFLALCFSLSLVSCGDVFKDKPSAKENSRVFYDYFDTWGTLYDFSGISYEEFSSAADEVEKILKDYHELCDIYNFYAGKNNLASVNANAGKGPLAVDARLIELLEYSKEIYNLTNGETNIAFGSVLKIWHEYREMGESVPDYSVLYEASLHTDIEKLVIDRENGTVELLDSEMSLDVGAVAKGYAVEKVANYLESCGFTSMVMDMGGNLRAIGSKPDGAAFSAGIKSPFGDGKYAATLEIANEALVTSGSYARFYTVDGVRYHHIIDEDTLFPKNDYVSVSIKAPSSALADALSTALFNLTISEAEELLSAMPEVTVIFVKPSGEVLKLGK